MRPGSVAEVLKMPFYDRLWWALDYMESMRELIVYNTPILYDDGHTDDEPSTLITSWDEAKAEAIKRHVDGIPVPGVVFPPDSDHRYLQFGPVETEQYGTLGMPAVEIGKEVCEVLTKFNIETEWDGRAESRIRVVVPPDAIAEER